MVTAENYEEFMILSADGELSAEEERELMAFLELNPALKAEMDTYASLKLVPDEELVYTDKQSLLKPETNKQIFIPRLYRSYGIAAGILLLIGTSYIIFEKSQRNPIETNNVATLPVKDTNHQNTKIVNADSQKSQPITPAPKPNNIQVVVKSVAPASTHKNNPKELIRPLHQSPVHTVPTQANENLVARVEQAVLTSLPMMDAQQIASTHILKTDTLNFITTESEPIVATLSADEKRRSFIDKLPLTEVKKEGLAKVSGAIVNTYDQIQSLKKEVESTNVTLAVRNRKLIISF